MSLQLLTLQRSVNLRQEQVLPACIVFQKYNEKYIMTHDDATGINDNYTPIRVLISCNGLREDWTKRFPCKTVFEVF